MELRPIAAGMRRFAVLALTEKRSTDLHGKTSTAAWQPCDVPLGDRSPTKNTLRGLAAYPPALDIALTGAA